MLGKLVNFSWPEKTRLSRTAFGIVKTLRNSGFQTFIAGGAVRDALLRRPISEIDIATAAPPETVEKLFAKTIPTGKKHGTITVVINETSYEVTTFRTEGAYARHRRPKSVKFVNSAEIDARRRDFTINALFYDPAVKEVLDYVGGIAAISHRQIVLVGDSQNRIREDALRMMRAVRFAAVLGFGLPKETRKAIVDNARLILKISAERVSQELDRMLLSPRASVAVGLLDVVGLLDFILPELKKLQGVWQGKHFHSEGDAYAHTLLSLEHMDRTYDLPTRYAVLFHDLGKFQIQARPGRAPVFPKHAAAGAIAAKAICQRLKLSGKYTAKIVWLVRFHQILQDFPEMKLATRRKWALAPYFPDLLRVYLADQKASLRAMGIKPENPGLYRSALRLFREVRATPRFARPLLTGREIMKILKIKAGPRVGHVLKFIEEKNLAGEFENKTAASRYLEENKNFFNNL